MTYDAWKLKTPPEYEEDEARDDRPATRAQLAIRDFMLRFHERYSMWPTLREICDHFEFASTNGVYEQLLALKRRGLVQHWKNCARGWVAVEVGAAS